MTPLAAALQPLVADAVRSAQRAFMMGSEFDPATSRREFVVAVSDFWLDVMGPPISRLLSEQAPSSSMRFELLQSVPIGNPVENLRTVDGVLVPHGAVQGLPHLDLMTTEWRCIVSGANRGVGEVLDRDTLTGLPWVIFASRSSGLAEPIISIVLRQLRLAGIDPRVEVAVPTFSAMSAFVHGTDRVGLVHHTLALQAQKELGFRVFDLPISGIGCGASLLVAPKSLR